MRRIFVLASIVCLFFQLPAQAVNPAMWSFSESTTGGDVFWTSPTAVDLGLPRYFSSYEITRVEAFTFFGVDVTDQLDDTTGSGISGPPPITFFDEMLTDSNTGTELTAFIEVDSSGFGQLAITDVTLGSIFGIPISRIEFDATMTIAGIVPGDFATNLIVDSLDLIEWESSFGVGTGADTDFDGDSDGLDFLEWQQYFGSDYSIPPLSGIAIPEPTTATGFSLGVILILASSTRVSRTSQD